MILKLVAVVQAFIFTLLRVCGIQISKIGKPLAMRMIRDVKSLFVGARDSK